MRKLLFLLASTTGWSGPEMLAMRPEDVVDWVELVLESKGVRRPQLASVEPAADLADVMKDPAIQAALAAVEGR